jgi:TonB family protein
MLPRDARSMFEDSIAPRGKRHFGGQLLAISLLLHLAALLGLLLATGGLGGGRADRADPPIDVLLLSAAPAAANPGGPRLTPPTPPTIAQLQAERARQDMLDHLVQPTAIPDSPAAGAAPPAADRNTPAGTAGTAGAAPALAGVPADAGGDVSRPVVIDSTRTPPDYPAAAQRAGLEGMVVVKAIIDEQGRVRDVHVLRGLGLGLDEAAVAAVRRWRFHPATRAGKPVKVSYVLSVYFRL